MYFLPFCSVLYKPDPFLYDLPYILLFLSIFEPKKALFLTIEGYLGGSKRGKKGKKGKLKLASVSFIKKQLHIPKIYTSIGYSFDEGTLGMLPANI